MYSDLEIWGTKRESTCDQIQAGLNNGGGNSNLDYETEYYCLSWSKIYCVHNQLFQDSANHLSCFTLSHVLGAMAMKEIGYWCGSSWAPLNLF